MKRFFEEEISDKSSTRRHSLISDLQKPITQKEIQERREAMGHLVDFINNNGINVKTVLDTMSGRGIFVESILGIRGLEKLTLNDMAEDCYINLQKKFGHLEKMIQILNQNFLSIVLDTHIDLVIIDFNNFTWNKKEQVLPFMDWVENNRKHFSYLFFTDSFYYSLKFTKDLAVREEKYQAYLQQTETILSMKLLSDYVYKTKNCSSLLLENKRGD